ncbi:IPT/TIG domain-containing protein, partial [Streptomyces sp. NBC_01590]
LTAITPSTIRSSVPITVTASGGTAIIGHFFYRRLPVLTQISSSVGSTNGGNVLTLTGLRFIGLKYVWFGTATAVATVLSDTALTVTVPASPLAHTVPVYLVNPGGVSNSLSYTYADTPTITGISPSSGPRTGSRIVNINGTSLSQVNHITFGGVPALSFKVMSANKVQSVTPPTATPGPVAVVVTTSAGATSTSPAPYTYT